MFIIPNKTLIPTSSGATIYVPIDYPTIQDAIDAAKPGDTVFVRNGIYYEYVIVDKAINLVGQDMNTTIIDANGCGDVLLITESWVNVSGFTITGSGSSPFTGGIELSHVENCIIENCNLTNNKWGIHIYYSHNSTIRNNICISNEAGIYTTRSHDNRMVFNNCTLNKFQGIRLTESNRNFIFNNLLNKNSGPSSGGGGITLTTSCNNTIINNDCSDPINAQSSQGIHIESSSCYNLIIHNRFRNAYMGIAFAVGADNNTLHHNNIVNNTRQVYIHSSHCNIWDDGKGEGNYWSDYKGLDDGSGGRVAGDGVGDTEIPHPLINGGYGYFQLDNYPLMWACGSLKNFIILKEGWNLISIPFIQMDSDLENVLNSINSSYDAVQWFNASDSSDSWKHNQVLKPSHLNDLTNIEHIMGFWIHIIPPGDTIFYYNGVKPAQNQKITLHPGWNMVGYPSLSNKIRTTALNNINFGSDVDSIWTHDAATQKWEEVGASDYFELGRGYWVHAKTNCVWEVPL